MLVSSEPKLIPMLLKLEWIYSLGVQMSNPYVHLQLYLVQIFILLLQNKIFKLKYSTNI